MEIETTRTLIRTIKPSDNKGIFEYRKDAETNKFQSWIPENIKEVDDFIINLTKQINEPDTWYQLAVVDKSSNQIIGDIGIHFLGAPNLQCELGITLSKKIHGKGYATEALKGVVSYLFNDLNKHRIKASIDPGNKKSIQLFERLGFRKEAHFKKSLFINGAWVDDVIYAMLKEEWKSKSKIDD